MDKGRFKKHELGWGEGVGGEGGVNGHFQEHEWRR